MTEQQLTEIVEYTTGIGLAVAAVIDRLARQGLIERSEMTHDLRAAADRIGQEYPQAQRALRMIADRAEDMGDPASPQPPQLRVVEKDPHQADRE